MILPFATDSGKGAHRTFPRTGLAERRSIKKP